MEIGKVKYIDNVKTIDMQDGILKYKRYIYTIYDKELRGKGWVNNHKLSIRGIRACLKKADIDGCYLKQVLIIMPNGDSLDTEIFVETRNVQIKDGE